MKIAMNKAILWPSPKNHQVLGNQKLQFSDYSPVRLGGFANDRPLLSTWGINSQV
ncbi:hypothetical protein DJ90_4580 [Paenibacillus macerans]|uniref:Uncharacterized protein n=1 Tax=Paenibacillus macerans TaxID=44252 RepID=A0A090Z8Q0_PAEMA|nr:hypothetical protein DJ90_4580 [Paenibacillus macerans]